MSPASAERRIKTEVLKLVRAIPAGAVVTIDVIAAHAGIGSNVALTLLAHLSDDEREMLPWHRVVAKGGAIGRGPHRDAQFARLVREGVPVSPAGIVQDLARVAATQFDPQPHKSAIATEPALAPAPSSRSRGMKDRPQ